MCVRMLGEPRATPTSIQRLLDANDFARAAGLVSYGLDSPSTAMSTTAECAFSTAVRNSSKYFGSVEGNTGLQGSILWMLNFSATCAAKFFSSILCADGTAPGELPSHPFHPTMNSRKG